jgi:hypothetical protein
MNMICAPCKNQRHDECPTVENHIHDPGSGCILRLPAKDKTWCDCQHRTMTLITTKIRRDPHAAVELDSREKK